MAKKLYENNDVNFADEMEAIKFFNDICKEDVWQRCRTKELVAVPIENHPLFFEDKKTEYGIPQEVSIDSIAECAESYQLGVKVPFDTGYKCYPIGDTAFSLLLERAGFQKATALSCLKEKGTQSVMPCTHTAQIVNMGFEIFKNKVLVLIRDEKVRAVLSGDESDYSILPFDKLLSIFIDSLMGQFADVNFVSATACHEYFSVLYSMKDKLVEESIEKVFASAGRTFNNIKIEARLTSSDVGMSGAKIYPFLMLDNSLRIVGLPLTVTHKNGKTLKDFKENTKKVFSMFKDIERQIEVMKDKKLKCPQGAFLRVAKEIGLPKKLAHEQASDFEAMFLKPTQLDLYWALYECLDAYKVSRKTDLSFSQMLNFEEGICRTLFGDIEKYDMPFTWE